MGARKISHQFGSVGHGVSEINLAMRFKAFVNVLDDFLAKVCFFGPCEGRQKAGDKNDV